MEAILHKNFKKQFKKIPPKVQEQFFERVELFLRDKFNPILKHHSVEWAYPGWWSINITGDWRALYEPTNKDIVVFMKIGTHSQLYG
jgi:addiction module RelE/StbE family toxin